MTITLELSSEQEHRLRAGAAQQDAQAVREVLLQAVDSTVETLLLHTSDHRPKAQGEKAVKRLLELSRGATSGSEGRRSTREELYERGALEGVEHPGAPASREPLAALRSLSGTAHSDFTDISTDKYAHVAAAVLDSDG